MSRRGVILVADDEEGIRSLLARVLGKAGHDVITAGCGEEALRALAETAPDVAVLDVRMPDLDGIEVLRRIKERDETVQGVMITAHSNVESAVQAMKLGAFDYVRKPFDNDELLAVIDKALDVAALRREVGGLRRALGERGAPATLIGDDPGMRAVLETVHTVARTRSTVLIMGESGTGKEMVARAIHTASPRRGQPFIKVNCAAISEELLESELFGHERGAFTGAVRAHEGKFELAHRGTILLDEVSEMSPKLQAKLLRVLQEREVDRVGGKHPIAVDVRVLATTNRRLDEEIAAGRFREDLYYRLNVVAIMLPPLRSRPGDIVPLAEHFLAHYNRETNRRLLGFSAAALELLQRYSWPGNVRQLQNAIERAVVLARGEVVEADDLPPEVRDGAREAPPGGAAATAGQGDGGLVGLTLAEMERRLILATLEAENWHRTRAAQRLGLSIRTIRNKLHEYARQGFIDRRHVAHEGGEA